MKIFKMNLLNWMVVFIVVAFAGTAIIITTAPQTEAMNVTGTGAGGGTATTTLDDSCNQGFLGFPSWYRGLTEPAPGCGIISPNDQRIGGISNFIWRIALNVVEMAVVAGAYMSGFLLLFGGWMFIISRGKPEGAAKARSIMTMAVMGLVLMISAVSLIEFVVNKVVKT